MRITEQQRILKIKRAELARFREELEELDEAESQDSKLQEAKSKLKRLQMQARR